MNEHKSDNHSRPQPPGDTAETQPSTSADRRILVNTVTYAEFEEELKALLKDQGMAKSTIANCASVLKMWMRILGRRKDNFAAKDLSEATHLEALGTVVSALSEVGKDGKRCTRSSEDSLKSRFRTLRAAFAQLELRAQELDFRSTVIRAAEKKGLKPLDVMLQAGVSRATAYRWLRVNETHIRSKPLGATYIRPKPIPILGLRSHPDRQKEIETVEDILGLPRASLVRFCRNTTGFRRRATEGKNLSPYQKLLRQNMKEPYRLLLGRLKNEEKNLARRNDPLVKGLFAEIERVEYYKTTDYPDVLKLKRFAKGKWRIRRDGACPTSSGFVDFCAMFFGYVVNKHSGPTQLNLGGDPKPSLAWFVDPLLLIGYLDFKKQRGGGFHSNAALHALATVRIMTHSEHGFLTQHAGEFGDKVGTPAAKFRDMCIEMHRFCNNKTKELGPEIEMSRNPYFPISRILDLQHPMEAIFLLLKRLNEAVPTVYAQRFAHAAMRRDIALIALLASNPLRARHFSEMRYKPGDDTSNLYRRDGRWFVRFPREAFKNFRSTASKERYDYPVADFAAKYLDDYIDVYRDRLGWGDEMDLVFPNARYGTENPVRFVSELSDRVRELTADYIPEFAPYGFRGHAFRHIVATEYIKNHPAGIQVAARVLHDKEETVRKAYSWVKGVDHAKIWTTYVDGLNDDYQSGNNGH
ncbi:MAG: hypothetical protein QOJ45_294 [Verrucomicrobiota bacterium]|jgi:integrase